MKYDLFTKYLDIEELQLKDSTSTIIIERHETHLKSEQTILMTEMSIFVLRGYFSCGKGG